MSGVCGLGSLVPGWWCRAAAEGGLTLAALLAALAAGGERRATFREVRRFAALEGDLVSTGHLVVRPGYLEKATDWPERERLQVEGDRVVLTTGNEVPRVIELGRVPELRVLIDAIRGPLTGDAAAVGRAFTATVTGDMGGWTLELLPREGAKLLRSVRLEGRGGVATRLALVQGNGDSETMEITPG